MRRPGFCATRAATSGQPKGKSNGRKCRNQTAGAGRHACPCRPRQPPATFRPCRRANCCSSPARSRSCPGGDKFIGKLGREYDVEEGQKAARICAINILANLKAALGDLEKVKRIVKLTGFVNCAPDFTDPHKVINGCSDFLIEVLGERGKHSRSAIGVATLPLGAAVEVEAIVEIA